LSEFVRPILSKVTNGRDKHIELVRYIVIQQLMLQQPILFAQYKRE